MNLFESLFRAFNKARIKYLVVGGVAVNLYGYVRFTGDLDILLLLKEQNLQKFKTIMKEIGYHERLPVSIMALSDQKQVKRWLHEKNLKAFSFVPPKNNPLQIDIIMEESLEFEKIVKNKVIIKFDNISIPVISIRDLVHMKKKANRDKDIIDLKALFQLKKI